MKISPMIAAVATAASLTLAAATTMAAPAPVYTMSGAQAWQKLTVAGCKTLSTLKTAPLTVSATFYNDSSYSILDSGNNPILTGQWYKVDGKGGSYTIYMTPDVYAPGPLVTTPPVPAGTLDNFLTNLQVTANTPAPAGMSCTVKSPGTQSVTFVQPSALIKQSILVVKSKNGVSTGALSVLVAGSQMNNFRGPPKPGQFAKPAPFSVSLSIKGTITP